MMDLHADNGGFKNDNDGFKNDKNDGFKIWT